MELHPIHLRAETLKVMRPMLASSDEADAREHRGARSGFGAAASAGGEQRCVEHRRGKRVARRDAAREVSQRARVGARGPRVSRYRVGARIHRQPRRGGESRASASRGGRWCASRHEACDVGARDGRRRRLFTRQPHEAIFVGRVAWRRGVHGRIVWTRQRGAPGAPRYLSAFITVPPLFVVQ